MTIDRKKLDIQLANSCMLIKDVCKTAGIAEPTLRQIRSGIRNPKPSTIGKIAKALNVNVKEIITEE